METIERRGDASVPYTRMKPRVIGGACEFCGPLNPNVPPGVFQYQLCPHFKEIGELRCSYCDAAKDPKDVVYHGNLKIHEHPDKPGTWIVVCDSLTCSDAHIARFKLNK